MMRINRLTLPLNSDELTDTFCEDVLRTDLSKFVNVVFVGNEYAWGTATRVMTQHKQIFTIDVTKCVTWLRFLKGVDNPMYENVNIPTEAQMNDLQEKMKTQVLKILNRKCLAKGKRVKALLAYVGSDTART